MQTRSKYIEQLEELESCVRRLGENHEADLLDAPGTAYEGISHRKVWLMQTRSKYIEQLEELESCVRRLGEKTVADVRAAGLALAGDAGAAEGVFQGREAESCVRRLGEKTVADVRAAGLALAGDAGAAEGVFQGREAEKRLQSAIESSCFDAMLLQQPLVAGDLRFVSGVFRIVSDLTHIGAMTRDVCSPPSRAAASTRCSSSSRSLRVTCDSCRAFSASCPT